MLLIILKLFTSLFRLKLFGNVCLFVSGKPKLDEVGLTLYRIMYLFMKLWLTMKIGEALDQVL
jgi:hypothetical protein